MTKEFDFDKKSFEGTDTKYKLAAKCVGVGRQTLYNTMNKKSSPSLETLELICQGLEVTLEEFFDWDTKKTTLSGEERMIVEKTRQLGEKDRQRILAYIDFVAEEAARNTGSCICPGHN